MAIDPPVQTGIPHRGIERHLTLLQHAFVQNSLPFLTSLFLHVAVIALGIATYKAVARYVITEKPQTIIPSAEPMPIDKPSGLGFRGEGKDADQQTLQNLLPSAPADSDGTGVKISNSSDWAPKEFGGNEADLVIGMGPNSAMGPQHGPGTGPTPGSPGLAPFGPAIGGDLFAPPRGNGPRSASMKVVFVCDATGSMMENFDNLRQQLRIAIAPMKPPQSVNVVFMKEHAAPPLDPNLLFATPENKRRLLAYLDGSTASGPTDPIPALKAAFAMKPDVIYFLCDPSDFPDPKAVINLCKALNADHKTKVNTICFDTHEGEETLKQIAADSGGVNKNISAKDLVAD